MDFCLDVTLDEVKCTEGSVSRSKFDLLVRALIGHQATLAEKALDCQDDFDKGMIPEILQDIITTNEMLEQIIDRGFGEAFYRIKE